MSRKEDIEKLISNHQRRLQKRKEQKALLGVNTDPAVLIEIEDIEAELEKLQAELDGINEAILTQVIQAPTIDSVQLSTKSIVNGGDITVTVRAKSDAPVNWINCTLDGPTDNIYGGGHGANFVEVAAGIWEIQWTDKISKWAPSGTYIYNHISVQNTRRLTSLFYPPLAFTVNNSTFPQTPVIRSVQLDTDTITNGGVITMTIRVESNAPVNWLNHRLDGPTGNIYGGGQGTIFNEVTPGIWEMRRTDKITKWDPSGTYTYSGISVKNAGRLTSNVWPPITFTVENSG